MSIAACAHRHVFGIKGDVKDNIGFMDEQTVLYPAGANTVLYNTETKNQKFIPVTEKGECMIECTKVSQKFVVANAAI